MLNQFDQLSVELTKEQKSREANSNKMIERISNELDKLGDDFANLVIKKREIS